MTDQMAESKQKWKIFKWPSASFVSKLAKIACNILLLIGSISTGSAGFKAIPILLALPPLNLIVIPHYIVTFICFLTFIAGVSSFYSQYKDDIAKLSGQLVERYAGSKEIPKNENELSHLHTRFNFLDKTCSKITTENKCQEEIYSGILEQIKDKASHSTYTVLQKKLEEINTRNNNRNPADDFVKEGQNKLNQKYPTGSFYYYFIRFISTAFILLGFAVSVGMGIIANQGIFMYFGSLITNTIITICALAAFFKQICQISNTAEKQDKLFCEIASATPKEVERFENKIAQQNLILDYHRDTQKLLKEFKAALDETERELIIMTPECKIVSFMYRNKEHFKFDDKIAEFTTYLKNRASEALSINTQKQILFESCKEKAERTGLIPIQKTF